MKLQPRDVAVAAAVAALIAAPTVTRLCHFPDTLKAEAAAVTAVVLVLLALGTLSGGWSRILEADRSSLGGLALYGAAAIQGGTVALVRGNQMTFVAGQVLSMILLPLGAVVGLELSRRGEWRPFATGLVIATGAGSIVQLVLAIPVAMVAPAGFRLFVPNAPSFSGLAPLGLFFATALAWTGRWPARALGLVVAGTAVVLIAGSGIRSQWLAIPFGVAAYAAVAFGRSRLFSRRALVVAGIGLAVVALALAAATRWWVKARPSLVPSGTTARLLTPGMALTVPLTAAPHGLLRIRGMLTCRGTGRIALAAQQERATAGGAPATTAPLACSPSASDFSMIVVPEPGVSLMVLSILDPEELGGAVSGIAVEDLQPRFVAELAYHIQALLTRPPDPGEMRGPDAFAGDASIAFRLREMRAIAGELRRSDVALLVFGHGLGATFPINTLGYDSRGQIRQFSQPNYIHNFFFFLPFKLGAVGTGAVLGALAIWVLAAVGGARLHAAGGADRHFFAAAAASWITYTVWSAAAPEILDFRMAAIWGMVAATVATAKLRPSEQQSDRPSRARNKGAAGNEQT
jgi:hypothetical protein